MQVEVWIANNEKEHIMVTFKLPDTFTDEQAELLTSDVLSSVRGRLEGWDENNTEMKLILKGTVTDG